MEKRPDKWYVILEDLEEGGYKKIRFTLSGKDQQSQELNPGDRIRVKGRMMP